MGGYGGNAPRVSTGTNEPLRARCTVLWSRARPHVIVTADVLAFGRSMHQDIRAAVTLLGVRSSDFVLTVTHTHNGPVLIEKLDPFISYNLTDLTAVQEYSESLVGTVVDLVSSTLAAPRTYCTLDYSVADEDFSFNREGLPYTEVDVPILVARDLSGFPRAVLFGYAAHPVTAGNSTLFDPDYPAQAIKEIESLGPDVFAQFLLGPAGDQNPVSISGFATSDALGADLGETVVNAIEAPGRPVSGPLATSYSEVLLPLDITTAPANLAAVRSQYLARAANALNPGFARRHAKEMVEALDAGTFDTEVLLPVQVWSFGGRLGLQIVFSGGEVVSGYAVYLRARYGGSEHLWFTGYSNEVPSYIPTDELLNRPSYAGGIDPDFPGIAGGSMSVYRQLGHFLRKRGPASPDGVEQIYLASIEAMLDAG